MVVASKSANYYVFYRNCKIVLFIGVFNWVIFARAGWMLSYFYFMISCTQLVVKLTKDVYSTHNNGQSGCCLIKITQILSILQLL